MRKAFAYICWMMGLCAILASCKPSLPGDVLSKGEMTDILYDYHVALAMAQSETGGAEANNLAYREAVLRKHDVTSAEFDSSMVYYMRHTELMHAVYKDLADRLDKEIVALGGEASGLSDFDNLSATGDTANIWSGAKSMVFSTDAGFNSHSFRVDADTAFHKGDRMRLDFESQFIFQDGIRDGIAVLAIQFKNDSTAQSVIHVQSSQHYTVELADNDSLGIKSVKGYFMLCNGGFAMNSGSSTTLKLMFIDRIKLIRMHPRKTEPVKPTEKVDSARIDSADRRPSPDRVPDLQSPPTGGSLPMPGKPMVMEMDETKKSAH